MSNYRPHSVLSVLFEAIVAVVVLALFCYTHPVERDGRHPANGKFNAHDAAEVAAP